jgi:hypothetical protein
MKDERGCDAGPNRKGCALAPISPNTGGDQKKPGHRGQFESIHNHALNMRRARPVFQPSGLAQSN